MGLSSHQLEAFLAVAQTESFTRAAAQLHITQSALSQRIQKLEEELGASLFIRHRSGARLTPIAAELVRFCKSKDHLEEEFLAQLKAKDQKKLVGSIAIGGFSSVMRSVILPSLGDMLQANAGISFQIHTPEAGELEAMLKRGEIDYMIISEPVANQELECVKLGTERSVLAKCRGRNVEDIYLDHDINDRVTFDYMAKFSPKTTNIRRRYLDDIYGLIDGVKMGLGLAVVPLHLIENIKHIEILHPKRVLEVPVLLYFYRQPYYSKLHQSVVNQLTQNAGKYLLG
jgi:DNA-binding transcriptional LysR family regulator